MEHQILIVSAGIFHPSLLSRFWLQRALRAMPGFGFRRVPSLERLPAMTLDVFQSLVLYFHHTRLSTQALACLDAFVRRGGGMLAVHSASASFKQQPIYHHIIGGRFTAHGPVTDFRVEPADPSDETLGRQPAFWVRDELYRHAWDPANRVHFATSVGGSWEPVVWTRRHGQGKVAYLALGHTPTALRHPAVRQILQRSLAWVCRPEPAGEAEP